MAKSEVEKTGATPAPNEDVHPLVNIITGSEFFEDTGDAFSIAMQLLSANSAEELLTEREGELTHANDVLGKPFMLHEVTFRPSDQREDWPMYAVMVVTWNGVKDVLSCGGMNVCVAAFKLAQKGWLPRMVIIKEREKATAAGFHPLNLVAAVEPAVEPVVDSDGNTF